MLNDIFTSLGTYININCFLPRDKILNILQNINHIHQPLSSLVDFIFA